MTSKRDIERRIEALEDDDSGPVGWIDGQRYLNTVADRGTDAPSPADRFGADATYEMAHPDWAPWREAHPLLAEYIETLTAVERFALMYKDQRTRIAVLRRRFEQEGADFAAFVAELDEMGDGVPSTWRAAASDWADERDDGAE